MKITVPRGGNLSLQEGNSEAIYAEIMGECKHSHPIPPAALAALEDKMHSILEQLSFANRLNCIKQVANTFKKHHYTFHQEPTLSILIMDTHEKIHIPFSLFLHSEGLKNQSDEEAELEDLPYISLPFKFTSEDLENYSRFLGENLAPIPDLETWLRVRITAERFLCDDEIVKRLEKTRPLCLGTLQEVETILNWSNDLQPTMVGSIASDYLNAYIDRSLKEGLSMEVICDALKKSKLVQKHINHLPINLCLKTKITQEALTNLASVLTNVLSLDVDISNGTVFPPLWTDTLLKLTISSPQIGTIPEALLSRLEELNLRTALQNYTTLNNRPNLKKLTLFNINTITAVPSGCPNLKTFEASSCPELRDFSSLNGLQFLEECVFYEVPVTAAPSGCPNLKTFEAKYCPELRNFSSLNGLHSLERCVFLNVPITAAPSGCPNLKTFEAKHCPELRDFSSLNGLLSLERCVFLNVHITAAPSGCPNLKTFEASYCHELRDFSSLNSLQSLERCVFWDVPITAAPSGCPNLKTFEASYCHELRNISGLNGLQFLERCVFWEVAITAAPSGCPNLKTFKAINCPELQDFSSLNGLLSLERCEFERVPITAAPFGCVNLTYFSAMCCSDLTDMRGLNDARKLVTYNLNNTPVANWKPKHLEKV